MKTTFDRSFLRLLSVLTVLSLLCGAFTATADIPDPLVISECDSLDNWTKTGGNALALTTNQAQAYHSAAAITCNVNYAYFNAAYTFPSAMDFSDYTYIEWDMMYYASGASAGDMWQQVVNAYGTNGTNRMFLRLCTTDSDYRVYFLSRLETTVSATNANWVHFKAKINRFNTERGAFDASRVTRFYFTTSDSGYDTSVLNGSIRIDNLYVTGYVDPLPHPATAEVGDVNADLHIDVKDLVRLHQYTHGRSVPILVSKADLNDDGVVDRYDADHLRKTLLGIHIDMTDIPLSSTGWSPVVKP